VDPPRLGGALGEEREAEGRRAVAFAGITLAASGSPAGGLLVDAVAPGSLADAAGVQPGDAIVNLDGVRVVSVADMRPAPGAGIVTVGIRRGSDGRPLTRRMSFAGFKPGTPAELAGAAGLLLAAAVLVLFFFAPTGGATAWLDRRVAAKLGGTSVFAVVSASLKKTGSRLLLPVVLAAISGVFALMPFSSYLVAADLDIGILFVVAATALLVAALVTGGGERYSLVASLRHALGLAASTVCEALAVLTVIVTRGSLRPIEIVRAQGGWPWQWGAFHGPANLVLCAVFSAAALAVSARSEPREGDATPRAKAFAFTERAHLFVMSGLASVLFLGGWGIPGLSLVEQEGRTDLALVGCALFLAKTWFVFGAGLWLRGVVPELGLSRTLRLTFKGLLPTAVFACAVSVGLSRVGPLRDAASGLQWIVSTAVFAVACLALVAWVRRVLFHLKNKDGELHLNPFL
jgi:NADH-quinone oxidoreductase subunit H